MEKKIKKLLKDLESNESLVSTMLGIFVVVAVGVVLYRYFAKAPTASISDLGTTTEVKQNEPVVPGEVQEGETPKGLPATHVVAPQETLWSIAERYYGSGYNWTDIAATNNLKNPNVIEKEAELTIPDVSAKEQTIQAIKAVTETAVKVEAKETVTTDSNSITGETYTVQPKDSLWSIAVRSYGDGYQWMKIYTANVEKIGKNPNVLEKDTELTIPR